MDSIKNFGKSYYERLINMGLPKYNSPSNSGHYHGPVIGTVVINRETKEIQIIPKDMGELYKKNPK